MSQYEELIKEATIGFDDYAISDKVEFKRRQGV
jgi:hypothetical protein